MPGDGQILMLRFLARASKKANYQYFKPVPVPGKQDTYYLESHMGRVRRRHGTALQSCHFFVAVRGVRLHRPRQ